MSLVDKYLVAEEVDNKEKIEKLKKRIEKVSDRASKLSDTRYKLVTEIEKIQKQMKRYGIKELDYVNAHDDPFRVIGDMMA